MVLTETSCLAGYERTYEIVVITSFNYSFAFVLTLKSGSPVGTNQFFITKIVLLDFYWIRGLSIFEPPFGRFQGRLIVIFSIGCFSSATPELTTDEPSLTKVNISIYF